MVAQPRWGGVARHERTPSRPGSWLTSQRIAGKLAGLRAAAGRPARLPLSVPEGYRLARYHRDHHRTCRNRRRRGGLEDCYEWVLGPRDRLRTAPHHGRQTSKTLARVGQATFTLALTAGERRIAFHDRRFKLAATVFHAPRYGTPVKTSVRWKA